MGKVYALMCSDIYDSHRALCEAEGCESLSGEVSSWHIGGLGRVQQCGDIGAFFVYLVSMPERRNCNGEEFDVALILR